ncbi:succinate receptor 1 [Xenopus laevis]|uniref:Succinate receptor 1 n=2 Tax=Xenopus laevis TaxID=8355 RepID=A0A8J1KSJ2_XENLA|nr:succinate receptor 1 [Xenopus laevis]
MEGEFQEYHFVFLNYFFPYFPQNPVEQSNCTDVERLLKKYYLSTAYTFEFVFGLLGNAVVLFGYIFCLKNWSSGSVYLFNLCISDFAFLCTLPLLVSSYIHEEWTFGDFLCKCNRYLLHENLYTSILFLAFISVDRYMLIKYPFREHFLQRKSTAIMISLGIWILVSLEIFPILTFIKQVEVNNVTICLDYANSGDASWNLVYSLCLTFTGFVIPLCVIWIFYLKMMCFLKNRNQQLPNGASLEKPVTIVVLAATMFSIFFTPYHVMRNVKIASRTESWPLNRCSEMTLSSVYIVTRPLAFLNSMINPVFYFLMGDHFREMLLAKIQSIYKSLKRTFNLRWP